MTIKIVTDSACDVPSELAQQLGISVVPVYINIGEKSYRDGVDMTRQHFYEQLPTFSPYPGTAAPAPASFTETYERLIAEGATHIISLHVASGLSATYNAARLGAAAVKTAVPITLIDTRQISVGAALLVTMAATLSQQGATVAQITAQVEQAIPHTRVFGMIDTLDALKRSGRVNWVQFRLGTLLKIKPIMMIANGDINVIERVRTTPQALDKLQEIVQGFAPFLRLAVIHTHAVAAAQRLQAETVLKSVEGILPIMEIGPAVGTHLGVGAVGFACISEI